jgi:putative membrane protein
MLKRLFFGLVVNIVALYIIVHYLPQVTYTGGIGFFVMAIIFIWLLNHILKPILKIVSLPFIFVTAGLFLIVINSVLFFSLDKLIEVVDFDGIDLIVSNKIAYIYAGLVFGVLNWFERFVFKF